MSMIINPYIFSSSGGGGTTPIAGEIIHLESDVAGIQLNSTKVVEWPDQSGLGNKAFQYVTSYQPSYISPSSEMNGLPSIGFVAASDQGLNIASASSLNISSNGFTIYMVLDIDTYPSSMHTYLVHSNDVVWTQGWGIMYYNTMLRFWINNWNNTANYVELSAPTINQRLMIKFVWDKTTMTAYYRQNGIDRVATKAFSGPYTNPAYALGIMKPQGGSSIYEAQGKVGAVLMYNNALSLANQATMDNYLRTKYGIA